MGIPDDGDSSMPNSSDNGKDDSKKGGCSGTVTGGTLGMFTLVGVAAVVLFKKRKED